MGPQQQTGGPVRPYLLCLGHAVDSKNRASVKKFFFLKKKLETESPSR